METLILNAASQPVARVSCNQAKGGKTPEQARRKPLSVPVKPRKLPSMLRLTFHLAEGHAFELEELADSHHLLARQPRGSLEARCRVERVTGSTARRRVDMDHSGCPKGQCWALVQAAQDLGAPSGPFDE
jgi:hypothetical protein